MKAKIVLIAFISIIGLFALVFAANEFQIFGIKFWGTRIENAKYEVGKNTQSFNDGMAQELSKIKVEWEKDTCAVDRMALEEKVRQEFANYNEKSLQSQTLRDWLIGIRGF